MLILTTFLSMFSGMEVVEADETDTFIQRSRERLKSASVRCIQPSTRTLLVLSRSAKIRMKASVPIPNLSEGILPPEAQPVTTEEALHHLAKRVRITAHYGTVLQILFFCFCSA